MSLIFKIHAGTGTLVLDYTIAAMMVPKEVHQFGISSWLKVISQSVLFRYLRIFNCWSSTCHQRDDDQPNTPIWWWPLALTPASHRGYRGGDWTTGSTCTNLQMVACWCCWCIRIISLMKNCWSALIVRRRIRTVYFCHSFVLMYFIRFNLNFFNFFFMFYV